MDIQKQTRRRGKQLEDAILTTVWKRLNEVGYKDLTIKDVALLSGTNKTTIYRRWPNKSLLAVSAFSKFGLKPKMQIPNTGHLRNDLIQFFDQLTTGKLEGLVFDRLHETPVDSIMTKIGSDNGLQKLIMVILKQAQERGDLQIDQLPQRVLNLPALLLLNEAISTRGSLSKESVTQIVDQILVPLFTDKRN